MRIFSLALGSLLLASCGGQTVGLGTPDSGGQSEPDSSSAHDTGTVGSDGASSSDAGSGGPDSAIARVPMNHRPNDLACMTTPPPGTCSGPNPTPPGGCAMDSDCTQGTNGRCVQPGGPLPGCECTYDTCSGDSDCPTGQTCACHDTADVNGGNECVPGNCRVDADCGLGGYCSPTVSSQGCGGNISGYYCHTPKDECVNDTDCPNSPVGGACTYSSSLGYWACVVIPVCA
jgi:hypothetical protein